MALLQPSCCCGTFVRLYIACLESSLVVFLHDLLARLQEFVLLTLPNGL